MSQVRILSSKRVLQTKLFDVFHERAKGDGFSMERSIVKHPGAAVMMACDDEGQVLLVRQFRLPLRERIWELPAGTLDAGESPLETAKRELIEETGYRAKRWRKVVRFYPSPGFCSEEMTVYEARDLTPGEATPEPYEKIEKRWVKWEDALGMVARGRIRDAKSIVALLYSEQFSHTENRAARKKISRKKR